MCGLNDVSPLCAPLSNYIIIMRCLSGIMSQAEHAKRWEQHPNGGDGLSINNLVLVPAACFIYKGKTWNHIKGLRPFASHNLLPWSASAFPCELGKTHPRAAGFIFGWVSGFRTSQTWHACTVLQTIIYTQGLEDNRLSQERSYWGTWVWNLQQCHYMLQCLMVASVLGGKKKQG